MKIKEHAAKSKRIGIRIIDTDEELWCIPVITGQLGTELDG